MTIEEYQRIQSLILSCRRDVAMYGQIREIVLNFTIFILN